MTTIVFILGEKKNSPRLQPAIILSQRKLHPEAVNRFFLLQNLLPVSIFVSYFIFIVLNFSQLNLWVSLFFNQL